MAMRDPYASRLRSTDVRHPASHGDPKYSAAEAAWESGDFSACLDALDGLPNQGYGYDEILLRARALIRMHRIAGDGGARAWLTRHSSRFLHASDDAAASYAMLTSHVRALCREFDEASSWLDRARRYNPHPGIAAEIEYTHALSLYQQDNFNAARFQVNQTLKLSTDILSARARALRGWINIAEGQYSQAHLDFVTALELIGQCSFRDSDLHVTVLYALAISAAELQGADPLKLDAEIVKFVWKTDMAGDYTQILRHIGLAHLHAGNRELARERFIASTQVAPGTPWSIFGYVELGNLAFSAGETVGPMAFADIAASIADAHMLWSESCDEERIALLTLSQLFARLGQGARAQRYQDLFQEKPEISAASALAHDTRFITFQRHVEACVLAANGKRDEAAELLTAVLAEWTRIRFRFHAADAEADLRRLDHWGCGSDETAELYPQLSSREEVTLQMLVDGKSDDAIAEYFALSPSSIKKIVMGLHRRFNVNSRIALIVKFRSRAKVRLPSVSSGDFDSMTGQVAS